MPSNEWAWIFGNEPVTIRRAPPISAPASPSSRPSRTIIGSLKAIESGHQEGGVWSTRTGSDLGGRSDDCRNLVLHRHAGGASSRPSTPRPARKSGSSRSSTAWSPHRSHWEQDGEQWVGVAAGWGGAVSALGRRGGQGHHGHQPGRQLLGLQAAEGLSPRAEGGRSLGGGGERDPPPVCFRE